MFGLFQNNCSAEGFNKQISQEPIKQRGRRKEEIEETRRQQRQKKEKKQKATEPEKEADDKP